MKILGFVVPVWIVLFGTTLSGQVVAPRQVAPATGRNSNRVALPTVAKPAEDKSKGKPTDNANDKPSHKLPTTRPVQPNRPGAAHPSEEIERKLKEFKEVETQFLENRKEMLRKAELATEDERAKIRASMRIQLEQFLQQQKERREDFRNRLNETGVLKDHGDLLRNEAKEQARERIRPRKGGED